MCFVLPIFIVEVKHEVSGITLCLESICSGKFQIIQNKDLSLSLPLFNRANPKLQKALF